MTCSLGKFTMHKNLQIILFITEPMFAQYFKNDTLKMTKQKINSILHTPAQNYSAILQNNSTLNSKKCALEQNNSAPEQNNSALFRKKSGIISPCSALDPTNSSQILLRCGINAEKLGRNLPFFLTKSYRAVTLSVVEMLDTKFLNDKFQTPSITNNQKQKQ
ncbi:MAG: hypothetical protein AB7G44_11095 [Bacteroidia bacterium]